MRKLMMMLVVMALLMAFPVAAGAKKPPKLVGHTCQDYGFDLSSWQVGDSDGDFLVTLTSDRPAACWDVISDEGDWSFQIAADGAVAGLQMHVKNSVPGDKCWAEDWKVKGKHSIPPSWASPSTPAAIELACGDRVATDEAASLVFMPSYWGAESSSLTITVKLP